MGILLGIVLTIVIVPSAFLWSYEEPEPQTFGQCLAENGVTMYGVDWCPNCQDQKRLFGEDFSNVDYVNCDFQRELCREKGVTMYPVWSKGTDALLGLQSFERLAEFSGCPAP